VRRWLAYLPGLVGWVLATYLAVAVTVWSSPFILGQQTSDKLPGWNFLLPPMLAIVLAVIPVRWPRAGGWFLGAMGLSFLFTALPWRLGASLVLTAVLFILEGRRQSLDRSESNAASGYLVFLSAQQRMLVTLFLPILVFAGLAALALG